MEQRETRWTLGIILGASLAVLAAHASLGTYSRFMADDYCSASQALQRGTLRAAWYWYRNWTGRYSANLLDAIFGKLGPGFTPAVTAIVLFLWLALLAATISLLISQLNSEHSSPLLAISMAAAVLFLTLAIAPNVPQALYWGQGMRSIVPPLMLMTLYIGLYLWLWRRSWPARLPWLWLATGFILTYGAGGFSETYTALQLAALVLTIAAVLISSRRGAQRPFMLFLYAGLLGAALSLITVAISPGNAARAAFYPPPPDLFPLLGISLNSFGFFLADVFGSGLRLLSLVAALGLGLWVGAAFDFHIPDGRAVLLILLLGLGLCFTCFPPAAYGLSDAPPDRTLLIPAFLLILTAVVFGVALGGWLAPRWTGAVVWLRAMLALLVLAAAISLSHLSALRPEYAAYANAWGKFNAEMVGFRQDGILSASITTAEMNANNWAGLNVLGDNPKFWVNECVSDYYGVRVISTSP